MSKITEELEILNEQGLHARPASVFVRLANKYASRVIVRKGDPQVDGKSIMGILTLEAHKGSKIIIQVEGEDAEEAIIELKKVIIGDIT